MYIASYNNNKMQSSILYFYRMEGEESFKPDYQGEETHSTLEDDLRLSDDGNELAVVKVRGWINDDTGAFICQVPECQGRRFKTTYTFSRHWTEKHVTPIKQFLCPNSACEKKNIHATDLKKHVKDKHNQVLARDHKFRWRTVANDKYLSPGKFFGPNERKFPVKPSGKKCKAVIIPVDKENIPMNAFTSKRKFQKIPKSVEFVEDDFSSDDEAEPPAKRVKSKVVVVSQKPQAEVKPTEEVINFKRQISVTSETQPEIVITVEDDHQEENSGSLSDDDIEEFIEKKMVEDGELEGDEVKEEEKNDKETEKEEIESLGDKAEEQSDSDSGSSSGSSSGEDSDSESEDEKNRVSSSKSGEKSDNFKIIPLAPTPGDAPGQSIVEIEKKLK